MASRVFYWDTSALLTLVFQESQSKSVKAFLEKEKSLPAYTAFFTLVEIESAIHRRIQEGSLLTDLTEIRILIKQLESGLSLIWPTREILADCRRAVMEYGLRPGDALQLASLRVLLAAQQIPVLVCLDDRLNRAAEAAQINRAF